MMVVPAQGCPTHLLLLLLVAEGAEEAEKSKE